MMDLNTMTNGGTPSAPLVKESSDRAFKADVIDASLEAPVLVDFWAPWCGPCRTLGPAIEKVVNEKQGKIRLVKINIDENPAIAGQLGVQSIPAVFAFAGGRPVDAFIGAYPESEVRRFAENVIAKAPAGVPRPGSPEEEIKQLLVQAGEALAAGDLGRAVDLYAHVLQHQEDNAAALIGIAKTYVKAGEAEPAQQALDLVPEKDRKGDEYTFGRRGAEADDRGLVAVADGRTRGQGCRQSRRSSGPLRSRRGAQCRGQAPRGGRAARGVDEARPRLERGSARKKLLELFEAWGPKDPSTLKGRRMLSALLFS
jgi:putative thioredoxin